MIFEWANRSGHWECDRASAQLRYAAVSKTRIFQFAELLPPTSTETDEVPWPILSASISRTKGSPRVVEMGRGIEVPPHWRPFLSYEGKNQIQWTLVTELTKTLERCSVGALRQHASKVVATGSAMRRLVSGSRRTIEALCAVIAGHMLLTEPYSENYYIGIAGVRFIRAVKTHARYKPWNKYLEPGDVLYEGEVGSTPLIRWIECIDPSSMSWNEALILGKEGLVFREQASPELRFFGRAIAWYGILNFGSQSAPLRIPERKRAWA